MGVLSQVLVTTGLMMGCYTPSFRDCTVTCASPLDCAGGQICGSDRLCASPTIADHCSQHLGDAGIDHDPGEPGDATLADARPVDAPAPDAAPTVNLHITITGKGRVTLASGPSCSSGSPQEGDCTFTVVAGVAQTLRAIETHPHDDFDRWTSTACAGDSAICTLAPTVATLASARFVRESEHD